MGFSLIFDALEYKLHGRSFIHSAMLKPSLFWHGLMVGLLVGIFFEYFGAFVSNLWWEPYYTFLATKPFWLAILIWLATDILVGYVSLFIAILEIYRVLNYLFRSFDQDIHIRRNFDTMFYWLAWLGLVGIVLPLLLVYYFPQLSPSGRGVLFALPLLGLWLILEFVEHRQHKKSFLLDIFSLKFGKIITVFITSAIIGLAIEGINLFQPVWSYKNFPFASVQIFHIPAIVLVAWVPFILLYLSFYEIFLKKRETLF